jgi:hypothetical protein
MSDFKSARWPIVLYIASLVAILICAHRKTEASNVCIGYSDPSNCAVWVT